MRLNVLSVFLAVVLVLNVQAKDYSNHVVISVLPENDEQTRDVRSLLDYGIAQTWRAPKEGTQYLVVESEVYEAMRRRFSLKLLLNGEELTKTLEDTKKRDPKASSRAATWDHYNTLDEINDYMDTLASENPTLASVSVLGTTWEGREMKMITITDGVDSSQRPLIVLDAGIHAREWVAPATATYIMTQLLSDPIIQTATFVILPSLNPDGYQFTWDDDRLWRKTRSNRTENTCIGVDGNRNWDFRWMEVGASNRSCSDIYAGPYPNSEPEFSALADFMNANKDRLQLYITLHSYSQLFMCPWGDTPDLPPTFDELDRVSTLAVEAMYAVHGANYTHGSTAIVLDYLDAGTSRDYMYGYVNVPYVYTIELRDEGKDGFELPVEQILPTAEETFAGFMVAAKEALNAMP